MIDLIQIKTKKREEKMKKFELILSSKLNRYFN